MFASGVITRHRPKRRHPRVDFKRQLAEMMRAEAAAVPQGRFGLLVRCGVPIAVRMAHFAA